MKKTILTLAAVLTLCCLNASAQNGVSVSVKDGKSLELTSTRDKGIIAFTVRGETAGSIPFMVRQISFAKPITSTFTMEQVLGAFGGASAFNSNAFKVDLVVFNDMSVEGPDKSEQFGILEQAVLTASAVSAELAHAKTVEQLGSARAHLIPPPVVHSYDDYVRNTVIGDLKKDESLAARYSKFSHLHAAPLAYVTDYVVDYAYWQFYYHGSVYNGNPATPVQVGAVGTCNAPLEGQQIEINSSTITCANEWVSWTIGGVNFQHNPGNNYMEIPGQGWQTSEYGHEIWDYDIQSDCDHGIMVQWWNYYGC